MVNKEDHHASVPNHRCPPRARSVKPSPGSAQLWLKLTDESRQRILGTLSRVVAQQLAAPPAIQEATNERH